jgi:hypothetical protein
MAHTTRPTRNNIDSLLNDWDADDEANFAKLFDEPTPVPEQDDASDEGDIQASFPVAQFGNCEVFVKHTILGWTRYVANGNAEWRALTQSMKTPTTSLTGTTHTLGAVDTIVLCSNAAAQAITLPSVSLEAGRVITIKQIGVGAVTVHRGGASTIDGATTYAIPAQFGAVSVYSDGTNWHITSKA